VLREIDRQAASGYPYLVILPILSGGVVYGFVRGALDQSAAAMVVTGVLAAVLLVSFAGFFMVHPNEVRVLQLFGAYVGTTRTPGLRYANPFYTKRRVSVRIRHFETEKLKVNDENSNPIEIAAVVVWRVVDSAEALFEVDDFEEYVHVQSESALRGLATQYPYDAHTDGEKALSSHLGEIAEQLQALIQERLNKAGVEVIEARISHLAYAPEIASAMLQRQQASAIIAARQKIVEGAVGMVEQALNALTGQGIVQLDEERKAAMVSNLLVVLCGDRAPQPVINTGTLYQ
jgi:regulator of protease activity HflC (stomatin/prohibitin superfamily)